MKAHSIRKSPQNNVQVELVNSVDQLVRPKYEFRTDHPPVMGRFFNGGVVAASMARGRVVYIGHGLRGVTDDLLDHESSNQAATIP
ncbi:hypothetical protein BIW11_09058 [Tropilaelaps mercedesae]|uniref:Uncharacterized protein n=1 Tax=Tropilaelaps mercedesae TaxID=418985 RepID=A0A1V9XLV0_9ACAR|nr:hypothetical protein BIW11_09058 [Tropilaelaps mercedesae]